MADFTNFGLRVNSWTSLLLVKLTWQRAPHKRLFWNRRNHLWSLPFIIMMSFLSRVTAKEELSSCWEYTCQSVKSSFSINPSVYSTMRCWTVYHKINSNWFHGKALQIFVYEEELNFHKIMIQFSPNLIQFSPNLILSSLAWKRGKYTETLALELTSSQKEP